jgi:phosphopantothenoylcysteine decarboxylase/phosphopantothenate--cysteine ligase
VRLIEPGTGQLASKGEWGIGRLAEPAEILAALELIAGSGAPRPLDGSRVLVTAGGTREPLDAVRFVGNRSSGRMGMALAEEAARRGAQVTVIAANVALPRSGGLSYLEVETAEQLRRATLEHFPACDVLLMAAAVADFRPAQVEPSKIERDRQRDLKVELVATEDVLAEVTRRRRPAQTIVGFAAEHGEGALSRARAKLERKKIDAIVVNDVSAEGVGFDSDENEVTVIDHAEEHHVSRRSKEEIAAAILDRVQALRGRSGARVEGRLGGRA